MLLTSLSCHSGFLTRASFDLVRVRYLPRKVDSASLKLPCLRISRYVIPASFDRTRKSSLSDHLFGTWPGNIPALPLLLPIGAGTATGGTNGFSGFGLSGANLGCGDVSWWRDELCGARKATRSAEVSRCPRRGLVGLVGSSRRLFLLDWCFEGIGLRRRSRSKLDEVESGLSLVCSAVWTDSDEEFGVGVTTFRSWAGEIVAG